MIPGEIRAMAGELTLNQGRRTVEMTVNNTGDRPVQIGSHFHFFEVNRALRFDRESAFGMRLDIPAGTAIRFEPGEDKPVMLTELGGTRLSYGLNGLTEGSAEGGVSPEVKQRLRHWLAIGGAVDENRPQELRRHVRADGRRRRQAGRH